MKENTNQPVFSPEGLKQLRKIRKENQTRFWKRFGVTQSRGSRFERGMHLPSPVKILIRLYIDGIIQERDLQLARRNMALPIAIAE